MGFLEGISDGILVEFLQESRKGFLKIPPKELLPGEIPAEIPGSIAGRIPEKENPRGTQIEFMEGTHKYLEESYNELLEESQKGTPLEI